MQSSHARLSASSAERWINCPGSIKLAEDLHLAGTSSAYADEGTLAHSVAEFKLVGPKKGPKASAERKKWEASEYWCGEMDEATDFYRDEVMAVYVDLLKKDASAIIMAEQRIDLTPWIPDGFGTSDAVVIGAGQIHVFDLKYGKGVKVEAPGNPQLRLYGLGSAHLFKDLYEFDIVVLHIIQPRLDHISEEVNKLEDLEAWGETVVRPAAEEASKGSEKHACGDWCRFCPAKAVCRARAEENLEAARYDFRQPASLSDDEIASIMQITDRLVAWVKDVSDYALQKALDGTKFEGWKLVTGRSNRKYQNEDKVVEELHKAGYEDAMLYERKLLTITAMEKLLGKKQFAKLLEDKGYIVKPIGKPVLVPVTDKREELNTKDAAAEDFALPF